MGKKATLAHCRFHYGGGQGCVAQLNNKQVVME